MNPTRVLLIVIVCCLLTAWATLGFKELADPDKVPVICGSPPADAWIRYAIQTTDGPNLGGEWRDDSSGCYYYPNPQNAVVTLLQENRRAGGR